MSREIKFRALYFNTDKSRCEWAYGLIGYMGDKGVQVFSREGNSEGNTDVFNCLKGTEGQFTGLRDKKGNEIYEGDILQPHRHTKVVLLRCEVYFDAGAFRLRGPQHTDRPLAVCMGDASRAGNDYVIIGNIHEHPELLNQTGH